MIEVEDKDLNKPGADEGMREAYLCKLGTKRRGKKSRIRLSIRATPFKELFTSLFDSDDKFLLINLRKK